MTQQHNPQNQQTFPQGQPYGPGQQPFVQAQQVPLRGATDPRDMSLPLYNATFWQAIARFFRGYFKFSGRASVREFWWAQLAVLLGHFLLAVLLSPLYISLTIHYFEQLVRLSYSTAYIDTYDAVTQDLYAVLHLLALPEFVLLSFISGVFGITMLIPTLALSWRRLQDANFHGAFSLLKFIPGGDIAVLVMAALPAKPEGQRFDKLPAGGGSQRPAPNYPAPGYSAPGGQAPGYQAPQPAPQPAAQPAPQPAVQQYAQPPVQQDPPQQQ